uniref:Phorbol-ester/DAG-type domain-containing protein n=1 Tax=Fagus sylvatica TaxID=28930 RepID=A0A2N9J3C2_FAGSY
MDKISLKKLREASAAESEAATAVWQAVWAALVEPSTEAATAVSQAVQAALAEPSTQMELQHFSHSDHPLVFNERGIYGFECMGCREPILGHNYSCTKCNLYTLHKPCAELPLGLDHPLHPKHPLILCAEWIYRDDKEYSKCEICKEYRKEYTYRCAYCNFNIHIKCASLPPTMEVEFHDHPLTTIGKSITFTCDLCGKEGKDFKCATLPLTTRYKQHEHPFTLYCTPEDDSGEYYCDICEEERDPKHWFYYCEDCNYPAHLQCILGKYPDCRFGDTYKFTWHPHRVTLIKEMKDPPRCDECHQPCEELIFQCTQCNFNIHGKGDCSYNLKNRL